jgi:ADP-ribose pyrophosphatase YjhB (NUDIX family)
LLPTDLTVSAVVERQDSFLTVEKRVSGDVVVTQPSARLETDESPEQAVVRGSLQETGLELAVSGLLGVYLWIHPQTRQQFLRIVYTAELVREHVDHQLDEHIQGIHWYSLGDIRNRSRELLSPIVQRCIEDYIVGKRVSDELLNDLMPIQQNVGAIMANACLV